MGLRARNFSGRAKSRHQSLSKPRRRAGPNAANARQRGNRQPAVRSRCPIESRRYMSHLSRPAALDPGDCTARVHYLSAVAVADPPATTETSRVERIPDAINFSSNEEPPPTVTASDHPLTFKSRKTTNERSTTMNTDDDHFDDEVGDLLTLHEVAELLRVPDATLRYWRHCRTGPNSYKIGRHVRYRRRDVHAWLRGQRSDGSPNVA